MSTFDLVQINSDVRDADGSGNVVPVSDLHKVAVFTVGDWNCVLGFAGCRCPK